jgi:methylthioxylose transferase
MSEARVTRWDLFVWVTLAAAGLAFTWLAVRFASPLGTDAAPFLGTYAWNVRPASLLAPAVAAAVLTVAARGWWDRARWPIVLLTGYLAGLMWTVALAVVNGARGLYGPANHPGEPPGPALVLRWIHRAGLTEPLAVGLLLTAVGALVVPLVLMAVRDGCGDLEARRYLPVVALAPYAVWVSASLDGLVAVLVAAMVTAGAWASDHRRTGPKAGAGAITAGLLLGVAAMFSFAVPWMGFSLVCLYFARRRAALNLLTGLGALVPVGVAQLLGFRWVDGLLAAQRERPVLWWGVISLAVLLLAAGPALVASLRKMRNTPGWPFLVGAGAAVLSTVLAGLARGGVELAWLTFFPWLTVAATAPERRAGRPVRSPLLLVGVGAATAVVLRAALAP